jgi:hypothetical protein
MIEEATVDAYGESEQVGGFYAMLDGHLAVPFETTVLGTSVTVKRVDLTERDEIVAICTRGGLPSGDSHPGFAAAFAPTCPRRVDRGVPLLVRPGLSAQRAALIRLCPYVRTDIE